jgi:hypothetical protein
LKADSSGKRSRVSFFSAPPTFLGLIDGRVGGCLHRRLGCLAFCLAAKALRQGLHKKAQTFNLTKATLDKIGNGWSLKNREDLDFHLARDPMNRSAPLQPRATPASFFGDSSAPMHQPSPARQPVTRGIQSH